MNAVVKASTAGMDRETWLSQRRDGIGGSDAGAIMGVNPYRSIVDVYFDKTGQVPPVEMNESMYWGTELEPVVAKEFEKRTGKKVRRKNAILQHPDFPWMLANIDREIVGENAVLECKTAREYFSSQWADEEVPASYLIQVQHYMAVGGYQKGYIAVLIGGNKFIFKEIERDEDLIAMIIKKEQEFWKKNVMVSSVPTHATVSKDTLSRIYPEDNGETVDLNSELDEDIKLLLEMKEKKKEFETHIDNLESKIKLSLQEAEHGSTGRFLVRWKTVSQSRLDGKRLAEENPKLYKEYLKQSSCRRFSVKEI